MYLVLEVIQLRSDCDEVLINSRVLLMCQGKTDWEKYVVKGQK